MKMFCRKCGKEIPANSSFCPNCGAKVSLTNSTEAASPEEIAKIAEEVKRKKAIKIVAITVGSLMVIASIIIGILISAKPTIDLNEYISVTIEGEDGDAWYRVKFDSKKLEEDFGDKVKISEHDELWYGSFSGVLLEKYVDWDVETTGSMFRLKNGDTVTLTWDCKDKAVEEAYGIKLKHKDLKIKVSGLK